MVLCTLTIKTIDMIYPKKAKYFGQDIFLDLFRKFIGDSERGNRLQKNGQRIKPQTIDQYTYVYKNIRNFAEKTGFEFKLFLIDKLKEKELSKIKKYWKEFYKQFTNYLYKEGCYDNYVGLNIRVIRIFFNYLAHDKQMAIGSFHRDFYIPKDEIPIVVLSPKQLAWLINGKELEQKLPPALKPIKDIFVFGCTVGLRVSDIMKLGQQNVIIFNDEYYLNVKSKKTNTNTSIKLPPYAVEIILRHKNKQKTLLPSMSTWYFNKRLKEMATYIDNEDPIIKVRSKKGIQTVVYKDLAKKKHYTLADHISSHTMRRTAITTLLSMGMPEHVVRKISGHAPNSKEFFKYVSLSQNLLDTESDKAFAKLTAIRA
jgi:integrase